MPEKFYKPTGDDALGAYFAAATAYNLLPPSEMPPPYYNPPQHAWLTPFGAFQVRVDFKYDANHQVIFDDNHEPLDEIVVCLYDKSTRLWLVTLQDGTVVRVRATDDGFVVVADEE